MALPQVDMVHVRRVLRTGTIVLGILVAISFFLGLVKPYTDYLWFAHDVRRPQVFTTMVDSRGWLFMGSFFIAWAMIYGNLRRALSVTLIYLGKPESSGQLVIGNAIQWVQQRGPYRRSLRRADIRLLHRAGVF